MALTDSHWRDICRYKETMYVKDLFDANPRFRGLRFSEHQAFMWLRIQDVAYVRQLWDELIETDLNVPKDLAVWSHLERMFVWLTHQYVCDAHGLLPITFAFCTAHHRRARWSIRRLAAVMPVAMITNEKKQMFEKIFQSGKAFSLLLLTQAEDELSSSAAEFWVVPPPPSPGGPKQCVLLLQAYGVGAPARGSAAASAQPHVLYLDDARDNAGERYASGWQFDLRAAPNSADLHLTVSKAKSTRFVGKLVDMLTNRV